MKRKTTWMVIVALAVMLTGCRHRTETTQQAVADEWRCVDSTGLARTTPSGTVTVADSGMTIHWDTMPVHERRRKPAVIYTAEQVEGEWVMGTLHEMYNADGTGMTWDVGEDVQAGEAKPFVWTLEDNKLTTYYALAVGGVVPHVSQVALVDSVQMVRRDDYGNEQKYLRSPQEMKVERIFAVR